MPAPQTIAERLANNKCRRTSRGPYRRMSAGIDPGVLSRDVGLSAIPHDVDSEIAIVDSNRRPVAVLPCRTRGGEAQTAVRSPELIANRITSSTGRSIRSTLAILNNILAPLGQSK